MLRDQRQQVQLLVVIENQILYLLQRQSLMKFEQVCEGVQPTIHNPGKPNGMTGVIRDCPFHRDIHFGDSYSFHPEHCVKPHQLDESAHEKNASPRANSNTEPRQGRRIV